MDLELVPGVLFLLPISLSPQPASLHSPLPPHHGAPHPPRPLPASQLASRPTPPIGSHPVSAPVPLQSPPSPQAGSAAPTLDGGLGCTRLSHPPGSTLKTWGGPLSQILGLPLHHHTHIRSVLPSRLLPLQVLSVKAKVDPGHNLCSSSVNPTFLATVLGPAPAPK